MLGGSKAGAQMIVGQMYAFDQCGAFLVRQPIEDVAAADLPTPAMRVLDGAQDLGIAGIRVHGHQAREVHRLESRIRFGRAVD